MNINQFLQNKFFHPAFFHIKSISWEKYKKNSEEKKKMNEAMAGYHEMYLTGSREIYQVW